MPRDLKRKEFLVRHTTNADRTVLREFANLAERLGFGSSEIIALKEHPQARNARDSSESSKPLLVTDGAGVKKKRRCGLPSVEEYVEDWESLFIIHLHDVDEEQGKGITSFFVRKSIYSKFFGKPSSLPLEELHPRDNAIEGQDLERLELERQEQERQELEKRKQERREQEEIAKQQPRRIQARKYRQGRLQRLKLKKVYRERPGGQAQEREEGERLQSPNLEEERRLEDQQRVGTDELLDMDQNIDPQPGEDIQAESSGARIKDASNHTTVGVNFKIRDRGVWKPASAHTVEYSDSSEIEKVVTNWARENGGSSTPSFACWLHNNVMMP